MSAEQSFKDHYAACKKRLWLTPKVPRVRFDKVSLTLIKTVGRPA